MIRILVADDIERHVEDIVDKLSSENYQIDKAYDSEEAISKIKNNQYDVVITDLYMENDSYEDGFKVIKCAKEKSKLTQVVVITAREPSLNAYSIKLGAYDFIERNAPGPFLERLKKSVYGAINHLKNKAKTSHE